MKIFAILRNLSMLLNNCFKFSKAIEKVPEC